MAAYYVTIHQSYYINTAGKEEKLTNLLFVVIITKELNFKWEK
jgi:hypothetical protein